MSFQLKESLSFTSRTRRPTRDRFPQKRLACQNHADDDSARNENPQHYSQQCLRNCVLCRSHRRLFCVTVQELQKIASLVTTLRIRIAAPPSSRRPVGLTSPWCKFGLGEGIVRNTELTCRRARTNNSLTLGADFGGRVDLEAPGSGGWLISAARFETMVAAPVGGRSRFFGKIFGLDEESPREARILLVGWANRQGEKWSLSFGSGGENGCCRSGLVC